MDDGLTLKTVNSSRSAYAAIKFKNVFFEKVSDTVPNHVLRFKISSRSCCNVFKPSVSLEKVVNKCNILTPAEENLLVIQFFCKYGIVKTFNMTIIDCEHLEAVYSLEQSANHLVLSTRILTEIINNFRQSAEELTMILKDGECTFQNYILQGEPNTILTQLPIEANEFDAYIVGCVSELTFCQKELRALLNFCELVSPTVRIYCDRPGRPVVFACAHETRLNARFVLATLPSDAVSSNLHSQRSQSLQPHMLISKTPVQIKQLANRTGDINISGASNSVLPDFFNDAAGDEVTLLATLPRSDTLQNKDAYLKIVQKHSDVSRTQDTQRISSPHRTNAELVHPRTQIRHSMTSPLVIESGSKHAPPVKKARSTLFSHMELSETDDLDSITQEAMDLELQQLTRCYDTSVVNSTHSIVPSIPMTPGRTVLVADSDDER